MSILLYKSEAESASTRTGVLEGSRQDVGDELVQRIYP